jgi:hypothetical protein
MQLEVIKGLDTADSGGKSISSAFNLSLHDNNRRFK